MSSSSARSTARLEARFLSDLSTWKLCNQEIDEVASQRTALASQREELQLVADELAYLDEGAVLYRVVGPLLAPCTLAEAKASNATRTKITEEEHTRLTKRERALATKQHERRQQLHALQQQLPHIPEAVYDV